jgi:acetate---CoA ligase (ADP-forming)
MASGPLIRDVILRDGSTLRLRTPSPADFDDIKAFYDALSQQSRYLRFHGYGRTDTAARDYAEADGVDRVALIGHHSDRVVAAAGYDRLREPAVAEVAFAVAEDFHGSGTATRMLEQLAEIAAERGIQRFDAEVMADNSAMLRVFKRAGFGLRRTGAFGELVVSLDIRPTEAVRERIEERDHRAAVTSLRPILCSSSTRT